MMRIDFQSDIQQALAKLKTVAEAQQMNFAVARALTMTAVDVQKEVRRNMPSRFTLRRQWIVQGIQVERATKTNLSAMVYSRDKFMGLQELGGKKSPMGNYLAVPTTMVRRTKTGLVAKADRPKQLGDKAEVIDFNGRKWLALKKPRAGAGGNKLRLLYLLVPRADIDERLGLRKDGMRVARERFPINLQAALEQALATARW